MLANQIGYYSLILGLIFSVLIIPISVKNFNNNKSIDTRIFSISFFQFFFVLVSFLGLIFHLLILILAMRQFLIIHILQNHYFIKFQELGAIMKAVYYFGY